MIDFLAHCVAGLILGVLTGLMPGVGPSMIILAAWPLLTESSLLGLFSFYIVLLTTAQYFGSVSAILFGVMGEITSAPAIRYGHTMANSGRGLLALNCTAYASFIASIVALLLSIAILYFMDVLQSFLTGNLRILIISLLFVMLIITNRQPIFTLCMIVLGLALGIAGYNGILAQHIIVPYYSVLDSGIPFVPLMVSLLVVPILIGEIRQGRLQCAEFNLGPWRKSSANLIPDWSVIRGSVLGFGAGLIPGVSYTISSNLAAAVERRLRSGSRMRPLMAAESANNAAAISAILPMLVFALPIVPSEVLVLTLAEMSGYVSVMAKDFLANWWWAVTLSMLALNLVLFVGATHSYRYLYGIVSQYRHYVYMMMLIVVTLIAFFQGGKYDDSTVVLLTMLLGTMIGLAVKNFESKSAAMIAFLLAEQYLSDVYRYFLIQGAF